MKELYIISSKPEIVKQLSQELGCSELFAHLLASRGHTCGDEADKFLKAPLSALDLGNCLYDMENAVTRIVQALLQREKILVFGDYDVDGITSTLTLSEFLKDCGARVRYYIPHRMEEGYGLFPHHIKNFEDKPDLIITVDCGASCHAAIQCARDCDIDVVVSDHHRVDEKLAAAVAHINPKRPECPSGKTYLCGVGIVFLLLIHLRKALRGINFWEESQSEPNLKQYCDLVALGTIADVSPLTGENRVFVKAGLQIINHEPRIGLKTLIEQNCNGDPVDAQTAAFRLIPVLNAAGRMQHADDALKLLAAKDAATAQKLTRELLKLNRKRQQMEQQTLQLIIEFLEAEPEMLKPRALVVTGKDWHEGIVGILAARLAEKYDKPVLVLSEREGVLKGSGRTPAWLDLFQCLHSCAAYLTNYGGHRLAAGLTLPAANFADFKSAFENAVAAFQPRTASVLVDAEIALSAIKPKLLEEICRLEPFGEGNTEPLFIAYDLEVTDSRLLGAKNNHLKLKLKQPDSEIIDAIDFNYTQMYRPGDTIARMLFHLRWNHWNGQKKVQIIVVET